MGNRTIQLPDYQITQLPDSHSSVDVAIVGAGAAGLATAIFTHRANPRLSIVLLESARKPGAKILISGGGRCNVTNTIVTEADFWGGRSTIVRQILRAFSARDAVAFFRDLGVPLHEEADGKLFPDSNKARDVLDTLLRETASAGATLLVHDRVQDVTREPDGFRIRTSQGEQRARTVVLATGGRSVPKTGSDGAGYEIAARLGHSIVPVTPGLAPLVLTAEDRLHRQLQGVSHEAELTVWVEGAVAERLRGALLWTHFGLSGPAALNASRHWARARLENKAVMMTASFCPGEAFEQLDARLMALARHRPKTSLRAQLATWLPASLAEAVLGALTVAPELTLAHLSRDQRRRLAHALTAWPLSIADTRGFNYAEVTAGGVSLAEINPATMESRLCRGLYLVGEILDVDGRIGGFNFQWAWASAYVAARSLVSR